MSARQLTRRHTTFSLTGALSVAALALTVTSMTQPAQASSGATAAPAPVAVAAGQPPARHVPAKEQRAVKHLDHAKVLRQSKPMPLPASRPLPAGVKAPVSGVDGPAVTVQGTAPSATTNAL